MWTGFNCNLLPDNSLKQRDSYLTPMNLSPINTAIVINTMEQAQAIDLKSSRIKIYAKPVTDLVNILEKNFNPFDSSLDRDNLYDIATAKPTTAGVAKCLLNIEKNGDILRKQFINKCADNKKRFRKIY
ncbi:unnamed protein product [Psylliodes chrysocephalus]|uniref:Uncharacterized protein n=1 Tax=Psylliodes chrysocephalus TaxID=3402493 RepID=A0A9P0GDE4_9CUCU|nr:unnamed protein product [Psylliodes chrysocephala]